MDTQMSKGSSGENGKQMFKEGPVAKSIERQTAKIPSDMFLWAAGGAAVVSLVLQIKQSRKTNIWGSPTRGGQVSLFIGQWAPTLLLLGVYNKIVKVLGRSDSAGTRI